jgi:hypothetical protein
LQNFPIPTITVTGEELSSYHHQEGERSHPLPPAGHSHPANVGDQCAATELQENSSPAVPAPWCTQQEDNDNSSSSSTAVRISLGNSDVGDSGCSSADGAVVAYVEHGIVVATNGEDGLDSSDRTPTVKTAAAVQRTSPASRIPSRKSSQQQHQQPASSGGGEASLSEDLRRLEFRLERYMSTVRGTTVYPPFPHSHQCFGFPSFYVGNYEKKKFLSSVGQGEPGLAFNL